METTPTVENAVAWFNAHTVTHHLDVVDRQAAVTVSLLAPFAELVTATRAYSEREADWML